MFELLAFTFLRHAARARPHPRELRNLQLIDDDIKTRSSYNNAAAMFKPTPSLQKMLRRLPLSTKQAGKEYYKGNRVGSLGTINKFGNFKVDWSKVRTYVVPQVDLANIDVRIRRTLRIAQLRNGKH